MPDCFYPDFKLMKNKDDIYKNIDKTKWELIFTYIHMANNFKDAYIIFSEKYWDLLTESWKKIFEDVLKNKDSFLEEY
jgi:hypothetical protein